MGIKEYIPKTAMELLTQIAQLQTKIKELEHKVAVAIAVHKKDVAKIDELGQQVSDQTEAINTERIINSDLEQTVKDYQKELRLVKDNNLRLVQKIATAKAIKELP